MHAHPVDAFAWQGVFVPGGYEWWRFEVWEPAQGWQIILIFFDGWPFDQRYVRAYARYRRRPTRITPPFPKDWRGIHAAVYRGAQAEHRATVFAPPGPLIVTADPARIAIGPGFMAVQSNGSITLRIDPTDQLPAIRLQFETPHALPAPALSASDGPHVWIASPCRYSVEGVLGEFPFAGTGVWEHAWGRLPVPSVLQRGMSSFPDTAAIDIRQV